MRVTDDGCGMAFEDVPTAFLRHATSKIITKTDLDNIRTLGFRGEALASVSAVAKVEVMTKRREDTYGTIYSIEGSAETSHDKSGCPDGTTIIIRDLFYNVPARAKFMKKDVTEANAISNIMQKITLSHPSIAFKLIRDNRMEFNSAGDGELFSAVYAIYGRDFARDLIPCDYEYNGIHVSGYVIKPLYSRNNRALQNFFVNGRYVRSRLCSAALENAYSNMIMTGKFPACVMMIDLAPSAMDVNIHPAKAEVRFTDEKSVSDAIYFGVKNALMNDGLIYEFEIKPRTDWTAPPPEEPPVQQEMLFTPIEKIAEKEKELAASEPVKQPEKPAYTAPVKTDDGEAEVVNIRPFGQFGQSGVTAAKPVLSAPVPVPEPEKTVSTPEPPAEKPATPVEGFKYISSSSFEKPSAPEPEKKSAPVDPLHEEFPSIRVVGEVFGLYVICESGGKMIMIDKHAAHERIIFERLRSRNCRQFSQSLLTGIKVLLTAEEIDAMESQQELLADLGFKFDFSQRPCVVATAVPTFIMDADIEDIVCEVANNLRMHKADPQSGLLDDMLHTVACKSAIKANDKNSPAELQSLAEQVCYNENIRHCPHGRPVMFTMTKYSIDHQFRRT